MNRTWVIILFVISICISFLLYGKSIPGSFVHDDVLFANRYELKTFSTLLPTIIQPYLPMHPSSGVWRPLSTIGEGIQFVLFGETPAYFHIVNILLNGINAFLIGCIFYALFRKKELVISSMIVFSFFPIHSEAVASIKSFEDLLAATFFLLSWCVFLFAVKGQRKTHIRALLLTGSAILAFFSVAAKETFIIGPLVFILVFLLQHKKIAQTLLYGIYYVPGIIIYLVSRTIILGQYAFGKDDSAFVMNPLLYVSFRVRLWTGFKMLFIYLQTILFPFHLTESYHYNQVSLVEYPWQSFETMAGIFICLLFLFIFIYRKTRYSPLGVSVILFIIPYSVVSKLVVTGGEFMAERWMYIPSMGIALIIGYLVQKYITRYTIAVVICMCILIGWYTTIVIPRNDIWLNNIVFTLAMVADSPNSVQALYAAGDLYLQEGNIQKAKQLSVIAAAIYPEYAPLVTLQGSINGIEKNYPAAEQNFTHAIELDPTFYLAGSRLAIIYVAEGKFEEACQLYAQLVPMSYGRLLNSDYRYYAFALTKTKRYQESIDILKQYAGDLHTADVSFLMSVNYYRLGQKDEVMKYTEWEPDKSEEEKVQVIESF